MKAANNARLKKLLTKQYRTREGIGTIADIVEHQFSLGEQLLVVPEYDENRSKKIREQMSSIKKRWVIAESYELQQAGRGSNCNLPEVIRFWELFDELMDNCTKDIYYISLGDDRAMKIPKMVYDYYKQSKAA